MPPRGVRCSVGTHGPLREEAMGDTFWGRRSFGCAQDDKNYAAGLSRCLTTFAMRAMNSPLVGLPLSMLTVLPK